MVVVVVMPAAPPMMMMMVVVMVMPSPPPAMMVVMMVGELRFTACPRLGLLPFVRHERSQSIGHRIEKLPIACRRRDLGRLRGRGSLHAARGGEGSRRPE
jgi:hypothetical protein